MASSCGTRLLRSAALATALLVLSGPSRAADEESTDALFAEGVAALARGAVDDAIDRFELLADRGVTHPDASYDRALSYIRRANGRNARPGDLGRAAAALEETLLFRTDDADARFALDRVHEEIARRRARAHAREVERKPSLGWAVVGLAAEDTWAALALAASIVLALCLAVRGVTRAHAPRLATAVAGSLAALLLAITGPLGALAAWDRTHARLAVVIADEARLMDENGAPIRGDGSIVPEGAALRMVRTQGSLAKVEWGSMDGWVALSRIRVLVRP